MTNTSRVGIVGFGAQGSVYAELISGDMVPNMDLGAICDGNPATRQLVESKYPAAAFYDDYLTMLDSGSVDAVVICVPSFCTRRWESTRFSTVFMSCWRSPPACTPSRSKN